MFPLANRGCKVFLGNFKVPFEILMDYKWLSTLFDFCLNFSNRNRIGMVRLHGTPPEQQ